MTEPRPLESYLLEDSDPERNVLGALYAEAKHTRNISYGDPWADEFRPQLRVGRDNVQDRTGLSEQAVEDAVDSSEYLLRSGDAIALPWDRFAYNTLGSLVQVDAMVSGQDDGAVELYEHLRDWPAEYPLNAHLLPQTHESVDVEPITRLKAARILTETTDGGYHVADSPYTELLDAYIGQTDTAR